MKPEVKEFAIELRKWWSFDEGQQHTHSWHDREDFIERKLPELLDQVSPQPVDWQTEPGWWWMEMAGRVELVEQLKGAPGRIRTKAGGVPRSTVSEWQARFLPAHDVSTTGERLMAKKKKAGDFSPDLTSQMRQIVADVKAGRINEARAGVLRFEDSQSEFAREFYAGQKWRAWQSLYSFIEFLELDGSIESPLAEEMRNRLHWFMPHDDEP